MRSIIPRFVLAALALAVSANFATIVPGLAAQEVRMRLGRPAAVFNVPWQQLQVWNYRYWPGDCVWYQVSISAVGRVREANYGTDPSCHPPGRD